MDENAPMFFLRGAPGAGKTTMAERIRGCGGALIFETDNFFVDSVNRHDYHFDSAFLGIAHSWNQGEVIRACRDYPTVPVIVANTFTHNWEIEPYLKIAKAFKRRVYVITLRTEHDNVHKVPDGTVQKHRRELEEFAMEKFVREGYPVAYHYTITKDDEMPGFAQNIHFRFVEKI